MYIPRKHIVSEKVAEDAHVQTVHGDVGLTMSKIREKYWIPKLRQLSKQTNVAMAANVFNLGHLPSHQQGICPKNALKEKHPFK